MKKILFVTSEAHPLIKTGGLADVSGSLPKALAELGHDIRIIIPNYQALKITQPVNQCAALRVNNVAVKLLATQMPDSAVPVWLVDYPPYFDLPGNPYLNEAGDEWPNNAERFALFCRVATEVAMNRSQLDWQPDIVHCNDWQSGLTPALLSLETERPATLFTIHNMAYQGVFPASTYLHLNLPGRLWHMQGLEFHQQMSFIKGGLVYADHITTVSPTYAQEIQTPEFGCGLEALLTFRHAALSGIINGIDVDYWNPETDPYIDQRYGSESLELKQRNKAALQAQAQLPVAPNIPLYGLISRLVEQKGIDLLLACLPELLAMPLQLVILGSGDKAFEAQLQSFAEQYPERIAFVNGYNEALSHLIEAGADIFLMPSRFEPCGLNQMYSQRYGTLPIVRNTGGLADTVIDALPETVAEGTASGFVLNDATSGTLLETIKRCQWLYQDKQNWQKVQIQAMSKDFSWQTSAKQYEALYNSL